MVYQPKSVSRKMPTPITEESVFTFGKHKGETIGSVLVQDATYLRWCLENHEDFADIDTLLADKIYEYDDENDSEYLDSCYDYDIFGWR